jgi:hypothetical protein
MKRFKPTFVAVALILCLFTTTAFAAWYFLRPAEVAERFEDITLSQVLESESTIHINESISSEDYTFTLLALVSGENLTDWQLTGDGVRPERTYIVAAIQRTDGSPMPTGLDEEYDSSLIFSTPMIKGLNPKYANIFAMNGKYRETVEEGIAYRIMDFDDISIFADRDVYFGICTGTPDKKDAFSSFLSEEAFLFDAQTGNISVNPQYNGTSIIFDISFDQSQANSKKVEKYLNDNYETFFPNGDSDFDVFKNAEVHD